MICLDIELLIEYNFFFHLGELRSEFFLGLTG
jgi:hypothetical protein